VYYSDLHAILITVIIGE